MVLLLVGPVALCALALAGNARADGSSSPLDPSAAAPPGAAQVSSTATTAQDALAGANATQDQPSNVVNSTRVDSPGDNGAITQTNAAQAQAAAANGSATTQDVGAASPPDGGGANQGAQLDATTQQVAAAVASAVQQGAQNIVIQIRINSPGDNGPISQTNTASSGAGAVNASQTSQSSGADPAPAGSDGATQTAGAPDVAPAPVPQPPAAPPVQDSGSGSAAPAGLRRAYPTTALARPRAESVQERHEQAAAAGSTRPPAADAGRAQLQVAPVGAVPAPTAASPTSSIAPRRASAAAAPVRRAAAVAASALGQGASRVFNSFKGAPPVASTSSADEVSSAVILTLVALMVGMTCFVAYTYAPPALRASSLWLRLRP